MSTAETTPPFPPSSVPRYRFGDTLERQERELAANPTLARMAQSRQDLAADPHRPLYHFVSPESTLNDPNGLCYWQGNWHLFYQANPPHNERVHWGHAVSSDLIHWRDLPYAIHPGPEMHCFSGSTLVEEDRVVAIYYGTEVGIMVATSSDPLLLNWEKLTGGPVIPILPGQVPYGVSAERPESVEVPYRVHDPCIWRAGATYYALSNGRDPWRPMDFVFRSGDLQHWEYLHPFVEGNRFRLDGDDGACPYFWPIGSGELRRHILLYFSHMSGGQYLLGDYDRAAARFHVTAHGKFNFGAFRPAGVHAPSATPDGAGGIVAIFNMNPGLPTAGWNQIMTLPRRLSLAGDDELAIEPAGDIASLRGAHTRIGDRAIPANRETLLEGIEGNTFELGVEIDTRGAPMVELNVLRSPDRQELTRIAFYRERGYRHPLSERAGADSLISIDSARSSILPDALSRAPETAPVYLDPQERLKLRVFVDRSVVEVFVNGRQCVALRVYPGRADSTGVSIRSQGRDIRLIALDRWQMDTIYR